MVVALAMVLVRDGCEISTLRNNNAWLRSENGALKGFPADLDELLLKHNSYVKKTTQEHAGKIEQLRWSQKFELAGVLAMKRSDFKEAIFYFKELERRGDHEHFPIGLLIEAYQELGMDDEAEPYIRKLKIANAERATGLKYHE